MMSVTTMYGEYRDMYEDDSCGILIKVDEGDSDVKVSLSELKEKVNSVVEKKLAEFFDGYLEELKKKLWEEEWPFKQEAVLKWASDGFEEFRKLCLALNNDGCGLEDFWCFDFARKCVDSGKIIKNMNGSFEQTLVTAQIEVSAGDGCRFEEIKVKQWRDTWQNGIIAHKTDEEIVCCKNTGDGCRFEEIKVKQWRDTWQNGIIAHKTDEEIVCCKNTGDGWAVISSKPTRLLLNPWTQSGFFVWAKVGGQEGDSIFRVLPRQSDYEKGYIEEKWKVGKYDCTIRIHCKLEGPDICKMYDDAKRNKR